jgi:hypothetical protein
MMNLGSIDLESVLGAAELPLTSQANEMRATGMLLDGAANKLELQRARRQLKVASGIGIVGTIGGTILGYAAGWVGGKNDHP